MRINEVFYSIQGEGVYQGIPTVFIRLQGCSLLTKCNYCDTSYAWDSNDGKEMEVKDIVNEVSKLSSHYNDWVCITGGEPLWQGDELEELVRELKKVGYRITVETNGSFPLPRWWTLVDSWCADIKCPSSGVCGVSKDIWIQTRLQDQVKFVVGTREDLGFVKTILDKHKASNPTVLISPITGILLNKKEGTIEEYWSKEWLQEVAEFCKENKVRFSLQWHKIVWGNKKGV